jgi:N-methylhydantoinase A
MLSSAPGRDLSLAILKNICGIADNELESHFSGLQEAASGQLRAEGIADGEIRFRRQLELRYRGQSSGIVLQYTAGTDHAESFHKAHETTSGHRLELPVELVNLRLRARAGPAMDSLEKIAGPDTVPGPKTVHLADLEGDVPVYERKYMVQGVELQGPAIISESAATSWIAPDWIASVDQWGNLRLQHAPG